MNTVYHTKLPDMRGYLPYIMNHKQVAQAWRDQYKDHATGHNVYFEGKTIYSYGRHFPIAYLTGYGVVLFNSDGYSNSTAKHKHIVRGALHGDSLIEICTETIKRMIWDFEHYNGLQERTKAEAITEVRSRIEESMLKEKRARIHKWIHQESIKEDREQLELLEGLPVGTPEPMSDIPL